MKREYWISLALALAAMPLMGAGSCLSVDQNVCVTADGSGDCVAKGADTQASVEHPAPTVADWYRRYPRQEDRETVDAILDFPRDQAPISLNGPSYDPDKWDPGILFGQPMPSGVLLRLTPTEIADIKNLFPAGEPTCAD